MADGVIILWGNYPLIVAVLGALGTHLLSKPLG